MKHYGKIILWSAVSAAVALGSGIVVSAAVQTADADEPFASDTITEKIVSENVGAEMSEPVKSAAVSTSNPNADEDESDIKTEVKAENLISSEEWAGRPHAATVANASEDFDYGSGSEAIPAEPGSEVYTVDDGVAVFADYGSYNQGYGGVVVVKHADNAYTLYGHLELDREVVRDGDFVKAGQLIGYSGDSGRCDCPALLYRFLETDPDLHHLENDTDYENCPVAEPEEYDYVIPVEGGSISGRYN